MDGLDLFWKDGALRWENGNLFVLPSNSSVKVGEHVYGFNKTIGKSLDGKKKRFWLGKDREEAERKTAHILNVWEILQQRDNGNAAWDEESLSLVSTGVNIDHLIRIDGQLRAATASAATNLRDASIMPTNGSQALHKRSGAKGATNKTASEAQATLYVAIDAFIQVVKTEGKTDSYTRRRVETLEDLKKFRHDCQLSEVDRIWIQGITNHIRSRPVSKHTGSKIAPATVKTYLQHWRQFFGWLDDSSESLRFGGWEAPKRWEKLFKVNLSGIMTKRERDDKADGPKQITISEIKHLLDNAKEERQRILILTALFTGQGIK